MRIAAMGRAAIVGLIAVLVTALPVRAQETVLYRLIQRGKLRACRVLSGKLLVPRSELLKLLKTE